MKSIKSVNWVHFVSSRFSGFDLKSSSSSMRIIPAIGIGFGVMALIVIISVMNGFQGTSINSLMEISSFHVRVQENTDVTANKPLDLKEAAEKISRIDGVKCVTPFIDLQGLLVGRRGKQSAAMIRGIESDILSKDEGFSSQLRLYDGDFDFTDENSIWLGYSLAKKLGVRVGDEVTIFALSGNSDVELFDSNRIYKITALFNSSYSEINSLFAFIPLENARKLLGEKQKITLGVKLNDYSKDFVAAQKIKSLGNDSFTVETWRDFNKSFFGALRIEKNVLMLLVLLIFLVVAINIYNGMRRMVFERRDDICILQGLGASSKSVQTVFVIQGLIIGLAGGIPGMALGLFISVNIRYVFNFIADVSYWFSYLSMMITNPEKIFYLSQNFIYNYYADIPAIINFGEVMYITIFGIFSAVISSYLASRKIMQFNIAEVLHDE